ncbi:hypothetical protein [Geomicrobium sp. JCM 19055]|nr:hypothetical protein [Geomicrobium sp. JCM 19055]
MADVPVFLTNWEQILRLLQMFQGVYNITQTVYSGEEGQVL